MTTLISSKHFRYPEFLQHILKNGQDRNQANFRPSVRFEIKVTLGGVGVFALHVW
jgi:hypothetical protein